MSCCRFVPVWIRTSKWSRTKFGGQTATLRIGERGGRRSGDAFLNVKCDWIVSTRTAVARWRALDGRCDLQRMGKGEWVTGYGFENRRALRGRGREVDSIYQRLSSGRRRSAGRGDDLTVAPGQQRFARCACARSSIENALMLSISERYWRPLE